MTDSLSDAFRAAGQQYAADLDQRHHDTTNPAEAEQRNAEALAQIFEQQLDARRTANPFQN